MNLLYPKIPRALLPRMLGYAVIGGLLAGMYGILHDQITYSISPEYFTHLKFDQFHYANFGLPQRVFVAEIGFLATWWVGFFSAWFIARLTVPAFSRPAAFRHSLRGFAIVSRSGSPVGAGSPGCVSQCRLRGGRSRPFRIVDLPSFVRTIPQRSIPAACWAWSPPSSESAGRSVRWKRLLVRLILEYVICTDESEKKEVLLKLLRWFEGVLTRPAACNRSA